MTPRSVTIGQSSPRRTRELHNTLASAILLREGEEPSGDLVAWCRNHDHFVDKKGTYLAILPPLKWHLTWFQLLFLANFVMAQ
jgi:hypothetical protein